MLFNILGRGHWRNRGWPYRLPLALMRRATGIDLNHYKPPTVGRRIARRMALHHLAMVPEYVALLEKDPTAFAQLQEDVLIHVTAFFREPASFDALRDDVLPQMLKSASDEGIRVWVPGCSSGEEVYSLAIVLMEAIGNASVRPEFIQIFGTDVSDLSVEKARSAFYPDTISAAVSPERLRRFFTKVAGGYCVSKALRDRCVFARQDTTRDPPFSKLDLILCRNMLIYFTPPVQRKVIAVFHYALKPGGLLMLGRAETPGPDVHLFKARDKKFKVFVKQGAAAAAAVAFPPRARSGARRQDAGRTGWSVSHRSEPAIESERLLLEHYAPPSVLIDDDLQVIRIQGRASAFLKLPEGDTNLNVLKMVRHGLLFGVRSAIEEARETGAVARKDGLVLDDDAEQGSNELVTVVVIPQGKAEARYFLVAFEAGHDVALRAGQHRKRKRSKHDRSASTVDRLQHELIASRKELEANIHDLGAANEELQSANKEVLSSNEELQSTNEELDTAKEELQSTNEELSTLNEELHGRNDELSEANSDLANLLASVQIPIVMVTNDLRVRRFTPAAEQTLNLIASDIGRPIGHIKPNILYADLERFIADVIQTATPNERNVRGLDGREYALRVRPYKNAENRITGAVLTLVDISYATAALEVAARTGEAIMSSVREPVLLLGSNLKVQKANDAFYGAFRLSPGQTEGRFVYELDSSPWDSPELKKLWKEMLPHPKNFQGLRVDADFGDRGRKTLLLDVRMIETGAQDNGVILLLIREK